MIVADAARLVGKKATVTVGRVLDGQVFAAIAPSDVAPVPITFESEAEKPTRAPSRKKAAAPGDEAIEAPESLVAEVGDEDALEPELAVDEPDPKQSTRLTSSTSWTSSPRTPRTASRSRRRRHGADRVVAVGARSP